MSRICDIVETWSQELELGLRIHTADSKLTVICLQRWVSPYNSAQQGVAVLRLSALARTLEHTDLNYTHRNRECLIDAGTNENDASNLWQNDEQQIFCVAKNFFGRTNLSRIS